MASGHKLYMWQYTKQNQGEEGAPPVALKTRRSLRAVHFHPLGLPLVLTAEVNDVSAPVTLPYGVCALPTPSPVAAPPLAPLSRGGSHSPLMHTEPVEQRSTAPHQERSSEPQPEDWLEQRRPHTRLSEVFRALMQEEREEELMAQLESSASLHASRAHASASRQILGLTGYPHAQPVRLHDHIQLRALAHRSTGGPGSLPHAPVPIRQPTGLPSRPRSFHPLRHSVDSHALVSLIYSLRFVMLHGPSMLHLLVNIFMRWCCHQLDCHHTFGCGPCLVHQNRHEAMHAANACGAAKHSISCDSQVDHLTLRFAYLHLFICSGQQSACT